MTPQQTLALAKRIMRRLEVFPSFRPSKRPEMAEEYANAIARMLTEFGSELTHDAVTEAIDKGVEGGGTFYPTPAQLRQLIGGPERDAEVFQVIDVRKFYSCTHGLFVSTPCEECNPEPLSWEEVCEKDFSETEG